MPFDDRGHAELAHAVVDVVAAAGRAPTGLRARPEREVRAGEVGRAADQLRQHRRRALRSRSARPCAWRSSPPFAFDLREQRSATCSRQSAGSSPAMRRSNSAARSGCCLRVRRELLVPLALRASRRARARPSPRRSLSGISNGGCFQPRFSRVAATSSSPSGAPCAAPVFAFFGAPLPITVLQQMSVGRVALGFRAARSPRRSRRGSWPSTPRDHVPAVGFEALRRVVGEPLLHRRLFRNRSRCRCRPRTRSASTRPSVPASEHASCEMPSIRQPSPRNT